MHNTKYSTQRKREKGEDNCDDSGNIKSLDEECVKLYEESTQVWTQLLENAEIQALEQRLQNCAGEGTEDQRYNEHSFTNRVDDCNY
jgi:hypothetical protein